MSVWPTRRATERFATVGRVPGPGRCHRPAAGGRARRPRLPASRCGSFGTGQTDRRAGWPVATGAQHRRRAKNRPLAQTPGRVRGQAKAASGAKPWAVCPAATRWAPRVRPAPGGRCATKSARAALPVWRRRRRPGAPAPSSATRPCRCFAPISLLRSAAAGASAAATRPAPRPGFRRGCCEKRQSPVAGAVRVRSNDRL